MVVQFNRFHRDVQRPAAFQHTKGKQWKVKYPLFTEVFGVRPQNFFRIRPQDLRLNLEEYFTTIQEVYKKPSRQQAAEVHRNRSPGIAEPFRETAKKKCSQQPLNAEHHEKINRNRIDSDDHKRECPTLEPFNVDYPIKKSKHQRRIGRSI